MRAPAVSLRNKLIALCAAALLACGLAPAMSLADDSQDDSVAASFVLADSEGSGEAATPNSSSNDSQQVSASQDARASRVAPMLASGLFGSSAGIINSDVALDSAVTIVGSFMVDGLTYAINDGGVTLISVAGSLAGPESDRFAEGGFTNISIPASVAYNGETYPITAIGPYAFYLSGATDVALSTSIASVDDRAFRSSDVARIEVDPANPNLASFDGALYDAPLNRLLLIPEGRKGSVLLSCETEVMEASKFSHCSLVEAISVEEGGAAFSSWEGCLYSADGTTLLRVPAGATDITIHDGCTTIAAGALEGCANLERINAPASVTSISPDLFESVPTVGLPAQMAVQDGANPGVASGLPDQAKESTDFIPQLTAMVALSATDDDLPEVDPSSIEVALPEGADVACWEPFGFKGAMQPLLSALDDRAMLSASSGLTISANGGSFSNPSFAAPLQTWWAQIGSVSLSPSGFYSSYYGSDFVLSNPGCTFAHWSWVSNSSGTGGGYIEIPDIASPPYSCYWAIWRIPLTWNPNGGCWNSDSQRTEPLTSTHTSNNKASGYQGTTIPTRSGYTFAGWAAAPTSSSASLSITPLTKQTYYAQWQANPYVIALDSQGGIAVSSVSATYDADVTLPVLPDHDGYAFLGWNSKADGTGTPYKAGVVLSKPNLATSGTVTLYARWTPMVAVDVPLEVVAEVDVLGLEENTEASGYIESRCGEPLVVTDVAFTPLAGAAELFGTRDQEVLLTVEAVGAGSPAAHFPLGAVAIESDPAKLSAFAMGGYGARVPISYRVEMAPDIQTSLAESAEPKPICSIAYTVALA